MDTSQKYCVIGAGPSGLTVVKNFLQEGIPVEACERQDDVGGNWYYGTAASSVYRSTHLISSKRLTEYTDFPMPRDYPAFPHHRQALDYLRSYARHFGLYEHIRLGTGVERIAPAAGGWDVTLAGGGPPRRYRGVVIANGHHWDPRWPEIPGHFAGQVLHAHAYKTPEVLAGRRVLVVGAGNSGCDIAVEAAGCAAATLLSMRRGYHFLPKFLFGRPIDVLGERLHRWGLPLWLRRGISRLLVHVALGPPHRYGLPRPDHRLFESHPIVNSQLLYHVGHGAIRVKPDVAELAGRQVRFADGTAEEVDVIVYATGYQVSFPFLDREHFSWRWGRPELYLGAFHPRRDDLFVAGLIQPDSGLWGLVDLQAQLMARFVATQDRDPPRAAWFRRLKSQGATDLSAGVRYVDSPRHALEVEHYSYRRNVKSLISHFPACAADRKIMLQ